MRWIVLLNFPEALTKLFVDEFAVAARAAQVADRFVFRRGRPDCGQLAGAIEPSQGQPVAPSGLDAIAGLLVTEVGEPQRFGDEMDVEACVVDFAHRQAAAYGVLAIVIALLSGWLASAVFRKT